jgi:hypothetical protein
MCELGSPLRALLFGWQMQILWEPILLIRVAIGCVAVSSSGACFSFAQFR